MISFFYASQNEDEFADGFHFIKDLANQILDKCFYHNYIDWYTNGQNVYADKLSVFAGRLEHGHY